MSNEQKTPKTNYAKLLGPEAIADDDVARIRHMEEHLEQRAAFSKDRRTQARRQRAARRFRGTMATLVAATGGTVYGTVNHFEGNPNNQDSPSMEAVYPAQGLVNSGIGKDGKVQVFTGGEHPAGAIINPGENGGHALNDKFVPWDQLTPAQKREAEGMK